MFFISAFARLSTSKPISEVLCGKWTGGSIFATNPEFKFENASILIQQNTGPNWLKANFLDEDVFINLSYVDLSGNITYNDEVFEYSFKQTSPPLISCTIQFNDVLAHISFASHTCVRVVLLNNRGDSDTLVFLKEPTQVSDNLKNTFQKSLPVLVMLVVFGVFQAGVKRAQVKMAVQQQADKKEEEKKAEEKKAGEEEEKKESEEEEKKETEEEEKKEAEDDGIVKRSAKKDED